MAQLQPGSTGGAIGKTGKSISGGHEPAGIDGLWKGVLANFAIMNISLQLTSDGQSRTVSLRMEEADDPGIFAIFRGSLSSTDAPTSLSVVAGRSQQGRSPAGGYWCSTATVGIALLPDDHLSIGVTGNAPGLRDCPLWTATLTRSSEP
ncbi:MAG: hypothetical protein ACLPKB_24585 [Xanthobacteraceae bacterium]